MIDALAAFHFLRPVWLLALPVLGFAAWRLLRRRAERNAWSAVVQPSLQPYVLIGAAVAPRRRNDLLLAALGASLLAVIALAGPTWERVAVPALRSGEALVVALDLSRSMDAADIEPSRLARAKLKLLALLERRTSGQTALVVFSAHAFTVTPLTTDTRTIAALVASLSTDLMPSRGSYPESGLQRAAQLLRQTGIRGGEILVISDADVSERAIDLARALHDEGIVTHVLAVGTADGAPIADAGGGFLTNARGEVVLPRVDAERLKRLAMAGGGRFASATPDDADLERLLGDDAVRELESAAGRAQDLRAEVWNDAGRWLALALLPLLALCFRRGWIVALWLIGLLPVHNADASLWSDLWQRRDQQAAQALESGDAQTAAELFEDPDWRGAAHYRAGDFTASVADWASNDNPDGHYNRGNALARAGDLEGAIDAYERALEFDPEHADAAHNLALVRQAAERSAAEQGGDPADLSAAGGTQESASAPTPGGVQPPGESGDGSSESATGASQASNSADGTGQASASETQTPNEARPASRAAEPGQNSAPAPAAQDAGGDAQSGEERTAAAAELEEWASEQAAEQWLRRIPQDPGGLLRRKFQYQYQRLGVDQEGNYVWPGDEGSPW